MTPQIVSAILDLETSNLHANFGVILCGVVKLNGEKAEVFRADELNPHWKTKRSDDRNVLNTIVAKLAGADIWIAHNGNRFDIPYLRTRLLRWGLPPLPTKKLIDPVLLARNKLALSFNSLEQVASHLGCNSKTPVDGRLWTEAALDGCTKAMDVIVKHCVQDVLCLEKVLHELKHYSGAYNTYGSGF